MTNFLKVIKTEVDNPLVCEDLTVERKSKSVTSSNRANCSHFKIVRKILEQLNGKARHLAIVAPGTSPG